MHSNVLCNLLPNNVLRFISRHYARNNKRITKPRIQKQIDIANPGVQKRINVLYDKENKDNIDVQDLEDLESDFMETGKVHKIHKDEVEAFKEREKLLIVRRKYFKEEKVNFLTWNDKEQIRHLHHTNPEEWTVEKLSEGFPALPDTIARIINVNWKPKSENRIKNHDKHVEINWKLLNEGKLNNLPKEVIEHVIKFSNRKLNLNKNEKIIIKPVDNVNTPGEYSSIIENYNKLLAEKNSCKEKNEQNTKITHDFNFTTNNIGVQQKRDRRILTLSELKQDIEYKIDNNKKADEYEKMIIKENSSLFFENISLPDTTKTGDLQTYKVETNKKISLSLDKKVKDLLTYPEKIMIPKEKYKKGYTYKINDCYYDYDGEFLYRVPGMN